MLDSDWDHRDPDWHLGNLHVSFRKEQGCSFQNVTDDFFTFAQKARCYDGQQETRERLAGDQKGGENHALERQSWPHRLLWRRLGGAGDGGDLYGHRPLLVLPKEGERIPLPY